MGTLNPEICLLFKNNKIIFLIKHLNSEIWNFEGLWKKIVRNFDLEKQWYFSLYWSDKVVISTIVDPANFIYNYNHNSLKEAMLH